MIPISLTLMKVQRRTRIEAQATEQDAVWSVDRTSTVLAQVQYQNFAALRDTLPTFVAMSRMHAGLVALRQELQFTPLSANPHPTYLPFSSSLVVLACTLPHSHCF
jgi:hypothetical protein